MGILGRVNEVAEQQRARNATILIACFAGLRIALIPVVLLLTGSWEKTVVHVPAMLVTSLAYFVVRRGHTRAGVYLCIGSLLVHHVAVVALTGQLRTLPYLVCVPVLLAAATLGSRQLIATFAAAAVALAAEAFLGWAPDAAVTVTTSSSLLIAAFLTSLLHVRGTERAFAIAAERDDERQAAADIAVASERRYRLIADNTDDLIALVDPEGRMLYLSPSHERMLGVSIADFLGTVPASWVPAHAQAVANQAFVAALEYGEASAELVLLRHGTEERIADARFTRVQTEEGPMVISIARDVTERRELLRRLHSAERMELLGRLAGGVAHDFNNLLSVISGSAELLEAEFESGELPEELVGIQDATKRGAQLTRQLLAVTHNRMLEPEELDLTVLVHERGELLRRMAGPSVEVSLNLDADCPSIWLPEAYFEQVLFNLVCNARDAMPDGGRLQIGIRGRVVGQREIKGLKPGTYAEVRVEDNGVGIAEDVRDAIFGPYFSTKRDAGHGIGLATCESLVLKVGGAIDVESELGKGTTFRVLLPQSKRPADTGRQASPRPIRSVLLVDDEPGPLRTIQRLLESSGIKVYAVPDARSALLVLRDPAVELDAILTDVVLGETSGLKLLRDCGELRPEARLVVMSGFAPEPDTVERVRFAGAQFLPKPFTREALGRALGRVPAAEARPPEPPRAG